MNWYALLGLLLCGLLALPTATAQERNALDTPSFDLPHERYRVVPGEERLVLTLEGLAEARALAASKPRVIVAPRPANTPRRTPRTPEFRNGATVFTVNSAFDDAEDTDPGDGACDADPFGDCTLRAAIQEANATPGPVIIEFDINFAPPGGVLAPGVFRITLDYDGSDANTDVDPLPVIAGFNYTIDGLTQSGASCGNLATGTKHDLRIVLDGSNLVAGNGIHVSGDGFTVRGLVVQNFGFGFDAGIFIPSSDALVECNYVGTDYTGETSAGNAIGIYSGGTIQNNLVSGNFNTGIYVRPFSSTTVSGNLVGSDADGNQPLGNGSTGIHVSGDGNTHIITTNLASANVNFGITLTDDFLFGDPAPANTTLTNNTVGLTRNRGVGPGGMGNGFSGISVNSEATNNDIGLPGSGQGNFVGNNASAGIFVSGSGTNDNRIRGNTVGLSLAGNAAPNGFGVRVDGPIRTIIGGLAPGEGNIISGNVNSGIYNIGFNATRIEGNIIGLNANGDARPNGQVGSGLLNSGIDLDGFIQPVRGNTISGNNGSGLRIVTSINRSGGERPHGENGSNAQVQGGSISIIDNFIGTTPDGSAARPNVESGLVLGIPASFGFVSGNTISGNTDTGIFLTEDVQQVVIENNFVGTNAAGADLGNGLPGGDGLAGIFCSSATRVRIGQNFSPNRIRFNGGDGIFLGNNCEDISIVGNIIRNNDGLAVDLAPNGPNPNDTGDGDTGANDQLNYPVIVSAENDGSNSIIEWTLNAEANTTYELLFCRTTTPDPSGFGECPNPNALATVTTNSTGNISGTETLGAGAYPAGIFVTANATEVIGPFRPNDYRATSEFAAAVEVIDTNLPPLTVTITPTNPPPPVVLERGDDVFFDITFIVGPTGPSSFEFWTEAVLPNNSVRSPLIGPSTINVTPPATVTLPFSQRVPNIAPFGSYTYRAEAGTFPSTVLDSDSFAAEIVPGRETGPGDWQAFDAEGQLLDGSRSYDFRDTDRIDEVASSEALPTEASLSGAYPNPFSRQATVGFALPEAQRVTLAVYDVLGREVAVLVDSEVAAGRHAAVLDGSGLPSGVYLVRLTAGGVMQTEQITLVR